MANQDASITVLRYNMISTNLEYAEGLNWYPVPAHSSGVSSLNTLTGAVTLSAGSNITLTPSGNNIAISSSGGITQLTGDVTAGPGTGSQAATLATVNSSPGSYFTANITVDSKGRVTAASNGGSNVATTAGAGTVSPGSAVGVNQFETTVSDNVTMNGPTSGVDGQKVIFRILNDASHSVTFATGAGNFEFGTTIPSYTNSVSLTDYIGAIYSSAAGLWHIVAVSQGF